MMRIKSRSFFVLLFACALLLAFEWGVERSPRFADGVESLLGARLRFLISAINATLPFSVTELFLLLLPLLALLFLSLALRSARSRGTMRRTLLGLLVPILAFFFLYISTFSVGYHKTSLATHLSLDLTPPTAEELGACALWLSELTAEEPPPPDGAALGESLRVAYCQAGERYGFLPNTAVAPKVTVTPLFLRMDLLGLYAFPFGEVTLARECQGATRTFTLAHEMAHASGYTEEAEADLIAFLACLDSGDPYLQYAGATGMLGRVLAVLSRVSPDGWAKVSGSLSGAVRREYTAGDRFAEGGAEASLDLDPPTYDETVLLLCGLFRRMH